MNLKLSWPKHHQVTHDSKDTIMLLYYNSMKNMTCRAKAHIAVVGCGGWTQYMHLPNLSRRSDAEISALVDPFD